MPQCIVISREITRQLHADLSTLLEAGPPAPDEMCDVILTTYGGDPNAGYRIARCLRHHYPKGVRILIPSFCKSAGTLIAIGANEIAIGDHGELGPLDIQITKPTEIREQSSGLDIHQALQFMLSHAVESFRTALLDLRLNARLSTKLAGEFAAKLAVGITAPLYAQVDPNRLGELQRAMRITQEYGLRLDEQWHNLQDGALDRLVGAYPSHGFVIDRKEAKSLFNRVSHMTPAEVAFSKINWPVVGDQSGFGPQFVTIPPATQGVTNHGSSQQATANGAASTAKAKHNKRNSRKAAT